MKISIVIPNYNGAENLKNNLPRIWKAMEKFGSDAELIIVDDASTDASTEYLERTPTIIKNQKNLGFAASCNIGAKQATGEIIVLLNSDVSPEENFLEPLVKHFQDPQVFAVGCLEKNVNEKNEIIDTHGVGKLFFKDGIFQHAKGDLNSKETDWVCGGSGAFRRNLFLKLGGFDTRFAPFYWEDVDLSYRAKKMGFKLLFEKQSVVLHRHLSGAILRKYSKEEIKKISFRNQIKFTRKHANILQKIYLLLFLLKRLMSLSLI